MSADTVVPLLGALISIAFFGGATALLIYLFVRTRREAARKRAWAIALATQYGFRIDPDEKGPPPHRFDLFGDGHSKKVTNQIWREGSTDSVFDYTFTTGGGESQTTHRRTCALIALPFDAPHTKIATEGFFSALGRRIGIRDIETESVRFNEIYRVNGSDERFAITLLDSHAIDWLLDRTPNGPGTITFELWGPWLLCVSSRMQTDAQFGFLDWAQLVPNEFPAVLSSLYPVGHQQPGAR